MRLSIRTLRRHARIIFAAVLVIAIIIWTTPTVNHSGTEKIFDRNGTLLFEYAGDTGRKQPVAFERFPSSVVQGVIATEDEHYFDHPGVDIAAVLRSIGLNMRAGRIVSGASTITQQVARLNSGDSPRWLPLRVLSKLRQMGIALRLSVAYSKQDLLSAYLNEVYLGNQNYGFQSAAQFYFHKNVDRLSIGESAYLVGMISSPARYDPYTAKTAGEKRKAYVLSRMAARGVISKDQQSAAQAQSLTFASPETLIKAPHFIDYIHNQMIALKLPTTNVSIYTTLDVHAYDLSQRIAREWVSRLRESHNVHNASMVVIDNKTGAIVSMLGSIDYFDSPHQGQVNVALSPRQPGSAIKLVTYTSALQHGFSPATLIYDVKTSYKTKRGEGFIPNNFGDRYHGMVLAREAFASSYNLPAVEMLNRVGMSSFLTTARALGITSFTNPDDYDYAITLGANEVSLLELSNAYATIARSGKYTPTYAIDHVVDKNGTEIYRHPSPDPRQVLGPNGEQVSYLISDILSDPEARMPGFGEKNYLTLSRPAAVKTGTTTDWHDVWTVGYTPSYTVGVWMGNNDNDAMRNVSSATGAAPVWNQFFEEFLKGTPAEQFSRPSRIVEKDICTTSGQLVDSLCPKVRREKFILGTEPKTTSSLYKLVAIDTRNGLKASPGCSTQFTEKRVLPDYPPEVYSWAVSSGKPVIPHDQSPLCGMVAGAAGAKLTISITNPKDKAVFQNAPLLIRNQGIVMEVNVSSGVKRVAWFVDNSLFSTVSSFPFSATLPLKTGDHIVYAKGIGQTGTVTAEPVSFRVIDY